MDSKDKSENQSTQLPDDVADAWAAVLIDLHEKIPQDKDKDKLKKPDNSDSH